MINILDSINSMPVPFNMIVLIVLIGCTAGVIGTISKQIRKVACHRQELNFKRELIDRGMSAEEVERVVKAGQASGREARCDH